MADTAPNIRVYRSFPTMGTPHQMEQTGVLKSHRRMLGACRVEHTGETRGVISRAIAREETSMERTGFAFGKPCDSTSASCGAQALPSAMEHTGETFAVSPCVSSVTASPCASSATPSASISLYSVVYQTRFDFEVDGNCGGCSVNGKMSFPFLARCP